MSDHGSVKSADTKYRINTHDYFVPAIVMVVLCILIVATFHGKEAGNHADGVADTTQTDKPAANKTAVTAIHLKALDVADASNKAINKTATSGQLIRGDAALAAPSVNDADTTADADVMSPAQTAIRAGNDRAVADPAIHTASTDKPAADQNAPDREDPASSGSAKQAPAADRRQVTHPMQDQGRRLHQEAMLAQRAHMMKVLEYRAEVMKRIEQDRRDLYRYRHNSAVNIATDTGTDWNRPATGPKTSLSR
jgi:hypothetical protein